MQDILYFDLGYICAEVFFNKCGMTQHTSRDEVWNHALRYALLEESFKLSRVENEITREMSKRTIRDTLNTMVNYGWLAKDSPQAHEWHPGPKALNIDEFEDNFNKSTLNTDDADVYSGVDRIGEAFSDRVSNSSNLVVEGIGGSHVLSSHGPLEESVKIPYDAEGNPLRVVPPRLDSPRVLVCREQSVVYGDSGVELIKQPELQIGDIVPVRMPLLIQTDDTKKELKPEDLDGIPLPLFANVDTLQTSDSTELKSGWRYAIRIDSINDRFAIGSQYDRTHLMASSNANLSSSSSTSSLDDLAESVGTVTDSADSTAITRIASDWDNRKKEYLTDVGNSYD